MSKLTIAPNLSCPDDTYAILLAAHDGLDPEDSAALNARLILILMNQIGHFDVLADAVACAMPQSKEL